jgi:transposase-like protein
MMVSHLTVVHKITNRKGIERERKKEGIVDEVRGGIVAGDLCEKDRSWGAVISYDISEGVSMSLSRWFSSLQNVVMSKKSKS